MSNVYNLEPPTKGKVVLHTTLGDIDIELWPKEAPKSVRNFVQLCLEGYYNDTIFHRVIRDYMVQGGDPTGTGTGGESAYGTMFKDEFHQRLKFNHRGLVACANQNQPNTNASQFFITLDKCDWLEKKNTIFGKVVGDTIFNLARYNEVDTDPDTDRPYEPPRITGVEVLSNPFEDIVLRMQRPSLMQQQQEEEKRKKDAAAAARKPGAGGKSKNLALLSFGEQAEEEEEEDRAAVQAPKRIRAAHDVLSDARLVRGEDTPADERINVEVSAEERERRRAALEHTRAVLAGQVDKKRKPDGDQDVEDEDDQGASGKGDSKAFAAKMAARIKDKRVALGDVPEAGAQAKPRREAFIPEAGDEDEEEEEAGGRVGARGGQADGPEGVRARRAQELESIKQGKRAYGKMQAGNIEVADAGLLKPWQVSHERYKQRKHVIGGREKDTLSRLAAFANKLQAADKPTEAAGGQAEDKEEQDAAPAEAVKDGGEQADQGYNGKVRDDIDHKTYMPASWRVEDYLDGDFLDVSLADLSSHKLAFTKNTGRTDNMNKVDDVDNYVVYDPLLEKAKGKFSKAAQKEKKRANAWAGKSNN